MNTHSNRITIGDYLLKRLTEAGVGHVLGVPGDFNLQFIEQIIVRDGIEFVGTCNELNASYAADGYARQNGCSAMLTTYGVGEMSAICGVAGAATEHVPMICITGAPPLHMMQQGKPLHHSLGDGNYANMMAAYREFTCAQALITPENAVAEIDRVIAACLTEKRPVYLQLPSNISFLTVEDPGTPLQMAAESAPESLKVALDELIAMVRAAEKPALLIDMDAARLGLADVLTRLAEKAQIPYAALSTGKAVLSEQSRLYAGQYSGRGSASPAKDTVEQSDCLITISPRFAEVNSGLFSHQLPAGRTVTLSHSGATIGNTYHEGVTAADLLEGLLDAIETVPATDAPLPTPTGWNVQEEAGLTQARLWPRIGRFLREDDVIVAESGTSYHGLMTQRLPAGAEFLTQSLWGAIGYTLPATLGAVLAEPDRRHLLFIGDGSFQLTAQELSTLLKLKLKPVIFLLNNRGYTIERHILGMDAAYNDIAPWNYTALPAAFGNGDACVTLSASTEGELEAVLKTAEASDKLCFIELHLEPEDAPEGLRKFGPVMAEFDYGPHGPRN